MTIPNLPMKNGSGPPWGAIILAVVVFGAVGYLGYQALKPIEPINSHKTKEDDRG